jgi:hypothetical protein
MPAATDGRRRAAGFAFALGMALALDLALDLALVFAARFGAALALVRDLVAALRAGDFFVVLRPVFRDLRRAAAMMSP